MAVNDSSLLESSFYSLAGAAAVAAIMPGGIPYATVMAVAGSAGIAYYFSIWSKFDRVFRNLDLGMNNCYPIKKRSARKDGYILYEFTLPAGLSVADVVECQEAIEQYIGARIQIDYGFKNLLIKVYTKEMPSKYPFEPQVSKGNVPVLVGCDRNAHLVMLDLSEGEPHMLIAGETGSGKSTVLRSIITNFVLSTGVELYLVDLKRGAEFNLFRKCKSVKAFARTEDEAEVLLESVSAEVDRRYDLFYEADCTSIKHYNRVHKRNPMKYQVVIIDEFADLMYEKNSIELLEGLAAKARACGIHLIISTQRPDAKVLSSRIKANVPVVLGLKTLNDTNSRIIIGENGLEQLRGAGHGILKCGTNTEVQCAYLSEEDARNLLIPHYRVVEEIGDGGELSLEGGLFHDNKKGSAGFGFLDRI